MKKETLAFLWQENKGTYICAAVSSSLSALFFTTAYMAEDASPKQITRLMCGIAATSGVLGFGAAAAQRTCSSLERRRENTPDPS